MFWGLAAKKLPSREGRAMLRVVRMSFAVWSAGMDVTKARCVHAPVGMWECSFGDFGATWLWQGTILPDPAVLHMLRYRYLELGPERSGLTFRILTSFLTYMGATKSFLLPLHVRPLIETRRAGCSSDLPHLPWRTRKIHSFNFQIAKKKTCLGMYFLLIANCVWTTQFSLIALSTKFETPVIASESKN